MLAEPATGLDEWLTTEEVANWFDISTMAVLHMIRLKRLPATKHGWVWFINRKDLPDSWPPPLLK